MPAGETYIRFKDGMTVSSSSRYTYSGGYYTQSNSGSWVDAHKEWGVSIDSTGLSALMTPAPLKDMITNSVAIENGKRVIRGGRKLDERVVTLGINMVARTREEFLLRYANFYSNVLALGQIDIATKYQDGVVYHLDYLSCQSFGEYRQEMAKFVLRLTEANPGNRT